MHVNPKPVGRKPLHAAREVFFFVATWRPKDLSDSLAEPASQGHLGRGGGMLVLQVL